jgi:hypothetical protein
MSLGGLDLNGGLFVKLGQVVKKFQIIVIVIKFTTGDG